MSIPRPIALESTNPVITLADGASGALIPLPTEAIARTFQQGDDLIIVLADGNRIAIADFFVLEAPSLILRDPASGDYSEVNLGEDGTIISQQPRSLSELAEMFNASAAELSELQTAQAPATPPPPEAVGSGADWNATTVTASVGVLAAIGAAVSGSDSDTDASTGTTGTGSAESEGVVVDGYISGAMVFQDLDADGVLDAGEPSTTANGQGRFTIALEQTGAASSQLVSVGGTDTSTNEPFTAVLTAPVDAEVISPLTTLVQSLVETQASGDNPISVAEANEQLASALGLSGSNLLELDPIAQLDTSATAYVASSQVAAVISTAAAAAPEDERAAASEAAAAQLAEQLLATSTADQPDATAVLQNQNAVQQVIQAALVEATDIVPAEAEVTAEAIAEKVVDANARLDAAADGDAAQETIEAVQQVIQRDLVAAIADEDTEVGSIDLGALVDAAIAPPPVDPGADASTDINDQPSGAVALSGTATEGETLTARTNTLGDNDGLGDLSYQWQRSDDQGNFANIANASQSTYTLGDADVGRTVQVQVRYTDGNGTVETLTSDASAAVTNINDQPSGAVALSGTATEGETLSARTDTLGDNDGLGDLSYQWQRSDDQGNFANIANASQSTYTLGDADVGRTVQVQVRYTDGNGTVETLTSDASAAVTNINDQPSGAVALSGTATEGETLSARTDTLGDNDGLGDLSYQWQRSDDQGNFANIANASQSTYTLGDADVGRTVQVQVRYTDGNGTVETLTSDASAAVTNINDQPSGAVALSGTATEGETLTARTNTLADDDGLGAFSYQWQRSTDSGVENIPNASQSTYTLGDADVGRTVQVQVRYTDGNGTVETLTSDASAAVTNINDQPSGAVALSGTATEGETLTARTNTLADDDGLGAFSYQWQRSTDSGVENIPDASQSTYTLGDADVGRTVQVQVRYTDGNGTVETLTSDASAAVTNINDQPSGAVALSGTATEGETLSARTNTLADDDGLGAFSYQWQRSTDSGVENIPDASQSTYTLGDADVGRTVQVQVRYTDGNGTVETLTSDASAAVTNINDQPSGAVALSGTATEGETLSARTDTLGDNDGLGDLSYQWQRSDDQGNFANIANASQSTYTLGDADVGRTVQVQVRYTDGNGTVETLTSDASAAVTNINDQPSGAVALSGTATEGETLTARTNTLADDDGLGAFSYQWQRSTDSGVENIPDASQSTYTLGDADVGRTVQVEVRYTDGNGTVETLTSDASAAVTNINDQPSGAVALSGTATEGETLTARTNTLADDDGLGAFSYQWQRSTDSGVENIPNASQSTYTLGDADVGRTVQVQVRYTDGNGTVETLTSDASAAVTNINDQPSGAVALSGTATEGETLTARTNTLADDDGLGAFSYQWQRSDDQGNFANIANASQSTYTLGDADVGRTVQVQVRYTDGNGTVETLTSDASAAVTNINDQPSGAVALSGTATEGETLTARTNTLADDDGLGAFSYQWQRSTDSGVENIPNASQSTYTLGDADVGRTVQVQVRYTDGNGTVETLTSDASAAVTNINDQPSGAVALSGTATEGETLTARTNTLADDDGLGAFSYQWQRSTDSGVENIPDASQSTYTLGDADVGRTVQVQVRYTDGNGTVETLTSDASAAVTNINDQPSGAVALSGTATEGETLSARTDTLGDNDGLGDLSYQWQRSDDQGNFANIANASQSTYTLGDADVGRTVQVQVRYTDGNGTVETLTSDASAAVTNINDQPSGAVALSGTATEGETLSARTNTLADDDGLGAFSYQWQRSTDSGVENIPDASQSTYTLGDADVGRTVQVQVRYTDGNGTVETLTSDASAAVTNINDQPSGAVALSGTATEGETLTARTNTLADDDGLGAFSYQWQRSTDSGVENIPNASQSTYTLGDADVGRTVQVQVRYTDGNGTVETLTSDASAAVTNINDQPSGAVALSGTATEGETLSARTDTLADDDGLGAFSYQWQRSTDSGVENIPDASQSTYTLGDADVGRTVQVQVRYTDGNGTVETLTSDASAAVTNINDQPSGAVALSGTATEGETLSARTDTLGDNDGLGDLSYQWQRSDDQGNFANIANASQSTYTLGDADVGRTVQVQVRYTDGNGTVETLTSDASAAVTNINDQPSGAVALSGTATEGETLSARTDTLGDNDGLGDLSYQWQRSDDQGNFANIANASQSTYTLGDADVGRTVQVQVRYTDGNGTVETLTSDASAAVTNINDQPSGAVALSGTATEGETLTARTNTLADDDGLGAFSYQWQRSTDSGVENIPDASQSTYTLGDADVGRTVQVEVRYTDGNGTVETLTSDASAAVTNINDQPSGAVTLSGTATEGETLTARTDTLADDDGLGAFSYQWQRSTDSGVENIPNASQSTYTLGDADVGRTVQVQVRYTDGNGTVETLTSDASAAVTNINDQPSGAVALSGTATEGETLSARTDTLADDDGLGAFSYQWQRSTDSGVENIPNASQSTYTLGDADVGRTVQVQVRYTDGNGTVETLTSDASAAVTNINDQPSGAVALSGTATEGETLSARTDTLADDDGLGAFSYQWQRSTDSGVENIPNASQSTYTLGDADVGRTVQVQVSYTDGQGTDESVTSDVTAAVENANVEGAGGAQQGGGVESGDGDVSLPDSGNQNVDVFRVGPGAGSDTITDFGTGTNRLEFTGGLFPNLEAVRASAHETEDGDLRIRLSFTETLTLEDTSLDDLTTETVTTVDLLGGDSTSSTASSYFFFDPDGTPTGSQNSGSEGDDLVEVQGTGNDLIRGLGGDDRLVGHAGDDRLDGGAGADVLNGGAGVDWASYELSTEGVTVSLETGTTGTGGQAEGDRLIDIENLLGGEGDDHLSGDAGANRLRGLGGNDTLAGGAGDDELTGGAGADMLDGGTGVDWATYLLAVEGVTASLATGTGTDGDSFTNIENLLGSDHDDHLSGDAGANQLDGRGGNDTLAGGDGDDLLDGGAGADVLNGGAGVDWASYGLAVEGVTVSLETGTAGTGGQAEGDRLIDIENLLGGEGDDHLSGDAGANRLRGLGGNDTLTGGAGDDLLSGGAGADALNGGAGDDDWAAYSFAKEGVTASLADGMGTDGEADGDHFTDIENLSGSDHGDHLSGDAGTNRLRGRGGDDTLAGGDGGDQLDGGVGADVLDGGAGDDWASYVLAAEGVTASLADGMGTDGEADGDHFTDIENLSGSDHGDHLSGDAGTNRLRGRGGNDTLTGGDGNDQLDGGAGADVLNGGAGRDDWAVYSFATEGVTASLADGMGTDGEADGDHFTDIENLSGSNHDDRLSGDAGANRFLGRGGNDTLTGGAGNDLISGGEGADVLDGGAGDDDWASYELATEGVTASLATNTGTGGEADGDSFSNIENLLGSDHGDQLTGDAEANQLEGLGGNDTLAGGEGDDLLTGGAGADMLDGGTGDDWASYELATGGVTVSLANRTGTGAEAEGDSLTRIENLSGGDHDDWLIGDVWANRFLGRGGNDTLTGGAGDDIFIFTPNPGSDRITDFGHGADKLVFHGLLFADLGGLRAAASQAGGNLEIRLSETETLTLEGGSLNNLTHANVRVVPAQSRASDAPVSETPPSELPASEFLASKTFVNESPTSETPADELMLNDETLIRLAESERMTLPPESRAPQFAGDQMSPADADEALAVGQLGAPDHIPAFDPDMDILV